jgi:hypothetical protein
MDDVWIETSGDPRDPSWVRADSIIEVSGSFWATSAGFDQRGVHKFAAGVTKRGFGLALLKAINQARAVERAERSAVILSWHGDETGWRIETPEAREDRFRAEPQLQSHGTYALDTAPRDCLTTA